MMSWKRLVCAASLFSLIFPIVAEVNNDGVFETARRFVRSHVSQQRHNENIIAVIDNEIKLMFGNVLTPDELQALSDDAKSIISLMDKTKTSADRYVRAMLDISSDPDCTTREFDAAAGSILIAEAAEVLRKCRVIIIRNALDTSALDTFKENELSQYIHALHTRTVSAEGWTSNKEDHIINHSAKNRWEILLPFELVQSNFINDPNITPILQQDSVLGQDLTLHSYGMYLSTPGAPAQNWHQDDQHLFGDYESVSSSGIGTLDLPLHAVTIMIPLMNVTAAHGPTEFCLGSHALGGVDWWRQHTDKDDEELLFFIDEKLRTSLNSYREFRQHGACPPGLWRAPQLNYGDVALFDYTILHRGGANQHHEARSAVYATMSRFWFKDGIFNDPSDEEEENDDAFMKRLFRSPRLAIPDGWQGKESWEELLLMSKNDGNDVPFVPKTLETYTELFADGRDVDGQEYSSNEGTDQSDLSMALLVTNLDVDFEGGEVARVLRLRNEEVIEQHQVEKTASVVIEANIGDTIQVQQPSTGDVIQAWEVEADLSDQLIVSSTMVTPTMTFAARSLSTVEEG